MVKRNSKGTLSEDEKSIVKSLLKDGWRNQDIQNLINTGRDATINSARITEVKQNSDLESASQEEMLFYIKKKNSYDPRTGLNLYDDERLIRAREAMILAVQVFNNPSIQFKTEMFAVQANIAWTYLLHEYYERKGTKIINDNGFSLLLSQMIKRSDFPLSKGVKNNIQSIITIRDKVEHRILRKADIPFYPRFQACCLNFDKAICELFNSKMSLQHELSLALQFSKLGFNQSVSVQNYDLPEHIQTLDAELEKSLSEDEKKDLAYQFKVIYTLESSTKGQSHFHFVNPESETARDIQKVLIKHKIADEKYPHKPKQVCEEVTKICGARFTQHDHTKSMYHYNVRPKPKSKSPETTNKEYCIYHKAHGDYTYSQKWIDLLISDMQENNNVPKYKSLKK